jgi:hypothetical protein
MLAISLIIVVVVVPNFFAISAFAVGAYESPCRPQEDDFLNAKKALEKCVDLLPQVQENPAHSLLCSNELKALNEKAKPLNACRNESR